MDSKEKVELKGFNIYQDKKGRTVYYDWISKNGYIIPESKYNSYTNYSIRLVISVLVGYLSALFLDNNYLAGTLIGLSTYIAYTFVFHKRFLSTLSIIPNFKRPYRENYIDRNIKEMTKKRALSIVFVSLFLLVAIIANLLVNGYDIFILVLSIGLSLVAVGFMVVHIIILVKKEK